MPPLKLLDTVKDLHDEAAVRSAAAAAAFAAAQGEVPAKRLGRDAAGGLLSAKLAEIDLLRRRLSEELTPAEIAALNESLRLRLIEARHLRRALLEAEAALALAEARLPPASAAGAAAQAIFEAARQRFEAETKDAPRRAAWLADLAGAPVADLKAAAAALLADAAFTAAKARVEGDVPTDLRTRSRARAKAERDGAAGSAAALADAALERYELSQNEGGPEVEQAAAQGAFAAAEAAVAEVVLRGKTRLEVARGLLGGIAASRPLTVAEKAAIAAATADGKVAAGLEKIRDDKAEVLRQKQAALDKKRLELRAANIDQDVEGHADIAPLKAAVATAVSELATANAEFLKPPVAPATKLHPVALDDWEAAVPDHAWANLLAFDRAKAILDALAAINPATLESTLATTEDAFALALEAADKHRRTREYLDAEVAGRRTEADVAAAFLDRRETAALRGDRHI